MRVGIDISSLLYPHNGIGRYTYQIISNFQNTDIQYFLYAPSSLPDHIRFHSRINLKISKYLPKRFFKLFWVHFILPFLLKRDNIELFWSPTHRLPLFLGSKIKSIVTIHDLVYKKFPLSMKFSNYIIDQLSIPYALSKSDAVICVSSNTKKDLTENFKIRNKKIYTILLASCLSKVVDSNNSIDYIRKIKPKSYILFVGTNEPRKNIKRMIDSYMQLPLNTRNIFKFIIVSSKGWGGFNIHKYISTNGLEKNILHFTYVNDFDLRLLYSKAKLLFYVPLYEGFGLPLVESISMGTPALASDNSSLQEVAGSSAIYINPFDCKAITKALLKLLSNKILLDKLKKKTLIQKTKFSWKKSSTKTEFVFVKILRKS